ncbi:hypothetical protein MFIFM68171_05709 [Madurella fahalii]|uniref:Vomeronasal type-1 receptor n=1 Tax=Madurella fahalii TaxID=1157608 RepID=A0ABQ0GCQ1_9PEZI
MLILPMSIYAHGGLTLGGKVYSVIMLGSLAAIVLVPVMFQGARSRCGTSPSALNSLISAMVVVLKASMLAIIVKGLTQTKRMWFKKARPLSDCAAYDKGGYSIFSALHLLWVIRARQIGASPALLAIMAAFAIDPLTQQVI